MRKSDPMRTHEASYAKHTAHLAAYGEGGALAARARTWLDHGTVDAWRHRRMYALLDPLLATDPAATWLTVGDGRYGSDANYIAGKGLNVVASDLAETLLREAKERGYIPEYRVENAEALALPDGAFDYVFCKESYHHFPRPMLALYEMLRVARRGVVLIEPNDAEVGAGVLALIARRTKAALRAALGRTAPPPLFEEAGNYLYAISRREMRKAALGLGFPAVAFRGINDHFVEGVQLEAFAARGPLGRAVRRRIAVQDLLCRAGLKDYGLLAAVLFKAAPAAATRDALAAHGYAVETLPENPFL